MVQNTGLNIELYFTNYVQLEKFTFNEFRSVNFSIGDEFQEQEQMKYNIGEQTVARFK